MIQFRSEIEIPRISRCESRESPRLVSVVGKSTHSWKGYTLLVCGSGVSISYRDPWMPDARHGAPSAAATADAAGPREAPRTCMNGMITRCTH